MDEKTLPAPSAADGSQADPATTNPPWRSPCVRCLNRYVVAKNVVAARPDILCRSGNNRSAKCSFCVAMRRPCFLFPPCDIRDVAARYQEELLKERPDEAILALLQPAASAAVGRGDSSKNDVQYTAALQHVREMEEQRSRPTESNELELPQVAEEVAWLRKEVAALREDLEALREAMVPALARKGARRGSKEQLG